MNTEKFYVEAPEFDESFGTGKSKGPRRDYAHQMDGAIIKMLNNKTVNNAMRQVVDLLANLPETAEKIASGVPISPRSYPDMSSILKECTEYLGIETPRAYISSSLPGLNAATFGSDEEPYLFISPLLAKSMSKQQLKFVIGHECGHIAMGHMMYHTLVNYATLASSLIPMVGPIIGTVGTLPLNAWSRRSEITADRAGFLCCGDLETAKRTLLQLQMPFMEAAEVDMDEYVRNSEKYLKGSAIRRLGEYNDAHPIIPKRMHALDEFASSQLYYSAIGEDAPRGAIDDAELNKRIEEIVKVI